ncbi:MAG: type I DNA topoisomerase [Melioribacteraceae bacterium]|nr:DNA topoisomerase I [Ignavibacteriota bacterium]MBZ0183460.1 type I DNA topoisomerase [Melioribacteraceae bacterium]
MAKNLVLVESPSKAKTINKYLGRNYVVEATVGHIKNLPKTQLGIDIENGFTPKLLNIRGKSDVIKKIRDLAKKSDNIYIATDPDREGEAIAQDIAEEIEKNSKGEIHRVLFNEITKSAVKKAMEAPLVINQNRVTSQRARRVMDRIIGYKISPLLWRTILEASGGSLSAGRVQSVALRLICEREEEIEKFIATEYWSIVGDFLKDKKDSITAKLFEMNGKTLRVPPKPIMEESDWKDFNEKYFAVSTKEEAERIFADIKNKNNFIISDIVKKEQKRNPSPPFITSTMQAEASRKLGFRPRKTMQVAQSLYEGVELGNKDYAGLITYMRTDSTRLSEDFLNETNSYLKEKFGEKYTPNSPKKYDKKTKKNVQDAHEAIRPTSLQYDPESIKEFLNDDQYKLYDLIWKRYIASQLESAILETTTVSISADEYTFRANGTVIKFDGFLKIYDEGKDEDTNNNGDSESSILPNGLEKGQKLDLNELFKNQHFTKPPARFSESTLIKELESNGIGRPSTYASIMSTIQDREYIYQENRKLIPTDLGKRVNDVLIKNFPQILNVNFTARMEEELDQVESGEAEYLQVLNDFYIPFDSALKAVEENIEFVKCDKCGSNMDIKIGRFGKFLACTNYPDCKNIKSLKANSTDNNEPEFTGDKCPKCGGKTVYKRGKFGKFIGCENYPDCDHTAQITLGIKCPKCNEGEVIARRSKRGKTFYGCSRYPDCDFISWTKPNPDGSAKESESIDEEV